jgi:hypothetical protein
MFTLIILGLVGWFAYHHFSKKKRNSDIRPVTRRLPWRDL